MSVRLLRSAANRTPRASTSHARLYSAQSPAPKANTSYLHPTHLDDPSPALQNRLSLYSSVTLSTYARPSFIISRGKGCKVYDTDNREYLDLSGGIAVNALGHADEGVRQVLSEQAGLLVHNSNLWHNEWSGELALLLVESTKELGGLGFAHAGSEEAIAASEEQEGTTTTDHAETIPEAITKVASSLTSPTKVTHVPSSGLKVFFSNSGTEANEGALKFVRKWGKLTSATPDDPLSKTEIVSFRDGFHGRSMGALSATWQDKYQKPFAPLVPNIVAGDLNDVGAVDTLINEKTCGVIVEPIQGEGGILEASEEFLRALRRRCDEVGALLIFDEIQCGLGRTGSLWAHGSMPLDCHPDIVTMAKPLANGIPIGAILMKDKVADIIKIGDHGTTFGGGPLQTRVAHHVLSRIVSPTFLPTVRATSSLLHSRLSLLPTLFPRLISSPIRGRGLILGVPFVREEYATRVLKLCRERGVLLLGCGKGTVRFVPSLTITEEEVELGVDVLESALCVLNREAEGL